MVAEVISITPHAAEPSYIYLKKAREISQLSLVKIESHCLRTAAIVEKRIKGQMDTDLIKEMQLWFNRKHLEVDYYLIQLFGRHGNSQSCLHTIGKSRLHLLHKCGE